MNVILNLLIERDMVCIILASSYHKEISSTQIFFKVPEEQEQQTWLCDLGPEQIILECMKKQETV